MEARGPGGDDPGTSKQRLKDRLNAIGLQAYRDADGDFKGTSETFLTLLLLDENSTNLLWEFFHQYYAQAFSPFYAQIAREHHRKKDDAKPKGKRQRKKADATPDDPDTEAEPEPEPDPAPPKQKKSRKRHGERAKAARKALLDSFMIQLPDGSFEPLSRCTAEQGLHWAARTHRNARFVELLSQPMQPTMVYGDYYTDNAEVERVYKLAMDDAA